MNESVLSTLTEKKIEFAGQYFYVRSAKGIVIKTVLSNKEDMELFGKHIYFFSRKDLKNFISANNEITVLYDPSDTKFEFMVTPIKVNIKSI